MKTKQYRVLKKATASEIQEDLNKMDGNWTIEGTCASQFDIVVILSREKPKTPEEQKSDDAFLHPPRK